MRTRILLVVASVVLSGCSSNWKLKETKVEMDDSVRYSVVAESEREQKTETGETVRALLAVTFEKNATTIRSSPGQVIKFKGRVTRLKVRFDEEDPTEIDMVEMPNLNGRYAYLGPQDALLQTMLKHKKMKIQWVLEFSGTPVDTFKLEGLKGALLKICEKAPIACKRDTPIRAALASVGQELADDTTSAVQNGNGWDNPASEKYAASCARANKDPNSYLTQDCECEVAKWKAGTITYSDWLSNKNDAKIDTMGMAYISNCAAAAGERAWTSEKRTDFMTRCSRTAFGAEACQCLLQRMLDRNLTEERMYALSEAKDKEINDCVLKNKPKSAAAQGQLELPPGTFPATAADWQKARDAVVTWCGANVGKCTEQALDDLRKPADGMLNVGADGSATLSTCSPGNCSGASFVEFRKTGSAWSIVKVAWEPMGD
jgi:uncharacterized protein YceK